MTYWFQDEGIKGLLPLATASAIGGLTTAFNTPQMFIGSNVFPAGPGILPSPVEMIANNCQKKRAFIVTDEFSNRFAPKVSGNFEMNGFTTETFSNILPEAPMENVRECGEAMTTFEPDIIVAVGGGSVMDGAKAAWIHYERPDVEDLGTLSPLQPFGLKKKAIFVAVPTTSGTGSECTGVSVVHDTKTDRKIPLANGDLLPNYAILCPEFTMTMPPKLTVGTGLDVLAHAMDSVMTPTSNELTEAISIAAIKMVFKYLPRAYRNGNDREARHRMLMASSIAGIGFGNSGAALTHSFGHSIGSIFDIHHGLAVGIFIPYVFQFYKEVSDSYLEICHALKIDGKTDKERFNKLIKKVKELFKTLDVPFNLKDLGIEKKAFENNMEKLILYSIEDIDTFFTPRPITKDQCEKILRYAYEGKDIDF
ncbi:MAG: iron-containing alcohol dehydrogenase [Deltaproteobacteria bacterium]|nr:iron-containing alcohol dehydrogenase [Deltaproteobacteria bacterium]